MRWVSPFGNLRIKVHLQLPEAYRSLSRPSSAPDAKAFPLRSYSLDLSSKQTPLIPFPSAPCGSAENSISLCCFSSPNFKHFVGLKFGVCRFYLLTSFAEKSISGFSSVSELCRLIKKFSLAEIVSITLKNLFPYCCLLIIASIIHNVQFSRCILELLSSRDSMKSQIALGFQSISFMWWRLAGSNR